MQALVLMLTRAIAALLTTQAKAAVAQAAVEAVARAATVEPEAQGPWLPVPAQGGALPIQPRQADPGLVLNTLPGFRITLHELTRSDTAARVGKAVTVDEGSAVLASLSALTVNVLQHVRAHYGAPLIPSSGYRPLWLNKLVGSGDTSQHVKGEACDFTVVGHTPMEVCRHIVASGLPFDQLILEFPSAQAPEGAWVHISHKRGGGNRGQVLTAHRLDGGKTRYLAGLATFEDLKEESTLAA